MLYKSGELRGAFFILCCGITCPSLHLCASTSQPPSPSAREGREQAHSLLCLAPQHDAVFGLPVPSSRPMFQPLRDIFSFLAFAFTMGPKRWPVIVFFHLSGFTFWEVSQKTNFYCDWILFAVKITYSASWDDREISSSPLFFFFSLLIVNLVPFSVQIAEWLLRSVLFL